MRNNLLELLICFVFPSILLVIVAIIGTVYRLRYAKQIFQGIKEARFDDFKENRAGRIRFYSAAGLLSLLGTIVTFMLVIRQNIAISSVYTLLVFILFLSLGSIAGILLLREVSDKLK